MANERSIEWPPQEWADALDALSAAWRSGLLPGWLFNGTKAQNCESIRRHGMRATDGAASGRGDGHPGVRRIVHLGTPEVAAWYMRETAVDSETDPALIAIDADGWLLARSQFPPVPLVDLNSVDYPVLTALGASSVADVRHRLGRSPAREDALAITGAVAFGEHLIPAAHIKAIRTPGQLATFLRRAERPPSWSAFQEAITRAANAQPWIAGGWRFSARALGNWPPDQPGHKDSCEDGSPARGL
jgi:hypothetical protein